MADFGVAADEVAVWGKALAANQVDAVTLTRAERAAGRGPGGGGVRVHLDAGTTPIWFTVDGSAPAVNGARSYRVRGTAGDFAEVSVPSTGAVVRLTSAGAVTYSVESTL